MKSIKFTKKIMDVNKVEKICEQVSKIASLYPTVDYDGWGYDGETLELFFYSEMDQNFLLVAMDIEVLGFDITIRDSVGGK